MGGGSQGDRAGTCNVVHPVTVTDLCVTPVLDAPVDLAPAPAHPIDTPVAAPLALAPVSGPVLGTNPPSTSVSRVAA